MHILSYTVVEMGRVKEWYIKENGQANFVINTGQRMKMKHYSQWYDVQTFFV
jgi:hypothetical protein